MWNEIMNHMDIIIYPLLVGILLSLSAAILGVVLVLKRYSMIGDGLSHVSFGVYAVALALGFTNASLFIVIPIVILAAYVLLRIGESTKIKGDAAIGLISSAALAIGYLVGSLTNGFTKDINSLMFGSIVFAGQAELWIIAPVAIIVVLSFILFYNRIFSVTFDEGFAKATGTKTRFYNMLFAFLTAITIVIGMRIMGTLLISSIIILPALSAMQLHNKFKKVIVSSAVISVICFLIAFFVFVMKYSSAASIVIVNLIVFCGCSLFAFMRKRFRK